MNEMRRKETEWNGTIAIRSCYDDDDDNGVKQHCCFQPYNNSISPTYVLVLIYVSIAHVKTSCDFHDLTAMPELRWHLLDIFVYTKSTVKLFPSYMCFPCQIERIEKCEKENNVVMVMLIFGTPKHHEMFQTL